MTKVFFVSICCLVVVAFGIAERAIHSYVIYPYLKFRGIQPAFRWYMMLTSATIAAYRRARSSAGEPVTWWYVIHGMRILAWVIVAAMLYSLWSK